MKFQTTNKILMVEPRNFSFNEQTAINNYFQQFDKNQGAKIIQEKALNEFNGLVNKIRENGIEVSVLKDIAEYPTPDSIFPNNWFISQPEGELFLSPMFALNRRLERKKYLGFLLDNIKYEKINIVNFSFYEEQDKFLEGTGSIILDRVNNVAFASLSKRCDKELFDKFCEIYKFKGVSFESFQTYKNERMPIYHTNVMLAVCTDFAVISLNSIDNMLERENLVSELKKCNKNIIEISEEQMNNFAGNIIQLSNKEGEIFTLMSTSAYNSFTLEQREMIEQNSKIIHSDISTIEKLGGGSVRCMIAELF